MNENMFILKRIIVFFILLINTNFITSTSIYSKWIFKRTTDTDDVFSVHLALNNSTLSGTNDYSYNIVNDYSIINLIDDEITSIEGEYKYLKMVVSTDGTGKLLYPSSSKKYYVVYDLQSNCDSINQNISFKIQFFSCKFSASSIYRSITSLGMWFNGDSISYKDSTVSSDIEIIELFKGNNPLAELCFDDGR